MRTPPLLTGATLLFWGWQSELLWLGALAAAVFEISYWIKARWDFTQSDLDRVWNLCIALFLGATIYAFFSSENVTAVSELLKDNSPSSRLATLTQSKRSLFQLLLWMPLMFLPIALVQAYASQEVFDLSTFSWWLRRKRGEPGYAQRYPGGLNVTYPYFACCVFSASTANQRTLWFTLALVAIVGWALWLHRSPSFRMAGWVGSLIAALTLGVGVQLGMLEVQRALQRLDEALLARWSGSRRFDLKENQTRIGAIGHLKLSGRILYRVHGSKSIVPELLREASYSVFHAPYWSSTHREFERVTPETNQSTWILRPASPAPAGSVTVAGYLPSGSGLLPVPNGLTRLDQLPALGLGTNRFGGVRVEDGPGFVDFISSYTPTPSGMDSPPTHEDREIPIPERPAVLRVAEQLDLAARDPADAIRAMERFFAEHFTYSTWQGFEHRPSQDKTALARFLLENRSGHCEYFGTAAVLLLRAAGIPARYAIGYSVQERCGSSYLIRERHAHAWCLAWVNGVWRDVDCTPPGWNETETRRASVLEPLRDLFSRVWFEFSRWRWGHAEWKRYLLWLVVPLLVLAVARVLLQRQWGRAQGTGRSPLGSASWPGLDSEFYVLEESLAKAGFPRDHGETGTAWLNRIQRTGTIPTDALEQVLAKHYRLRFHPSGLTPAERGQLRGSVDECLRWLRHKCRQV